MRQYIVYPGWSRVFKSHRASWEQTEQRVKAVLKYFDIILQIAGNQLCILLIHLAHTVDQEQVSAASSEIREISPCSSSFHCPVGKAPENQIITQIRKLCDEIWNKKSGGQRKQQLALCRGTKEKLHKAELLELGLEKGWIDWMKALCCTLWSYRAASHFFPFSTITCHEWMKDYGKKEGRKGGGMEAGKEKGR